MELAKLAMCQSVSRSNFRHPRTRSEGKSSKLDLFARATGSRHFVHRGSGCYHEYITSWPGIRFPKLICQCVLLQYRIPDGGMKTWVSRRPLMADQGSILLFTEISFFITCYLPFCTNYYVVEGQSNTTTNTRKKTVPPNQHMVL